MRIRTILPRDFRRIRRLVAGAGLLVAAIAFLALRSEADLERVHVVPIPGESRVSVQLIIPRALGSHGEEAIGMAHYAEHLAWLNAVGSKARAADRHSNAWTGPFAIGYWLSGPADSLPELLETLVGVFDPITLSHGFIEEEREIILQEYEQVIGSRIDAKANEAIAEFLYQDHPLGRSIIGRPAQIAALDSSETRAYHAATHLPEQARLIVSGDVDRSILREVLRNLDLKDVLSTNPLPRVPTPLAERNERKEFRFTEPDVSPRIIWRRVTRLDEPMPLQQLEGAAGILRAILYSGLPGGLAAPLRYETEIARQFDIAVFAIDEAHVELRVAAAPDRGISLDALQEAFETQIAKAAETGLPAETLARVHRRLLRSLPDRDDEEAVARRRLEHLHARLSALREPIAEEDPLEIFDDPAADAVDALLGQIAGGGRDAVAFIGPEEEIR